MRDCEFRRLILDYHCIGLMEMAPNLLACMESKSYSSGFLDVRGVAFFYARMGRVRQLVGPVASYTLPFLDSLEAKSWFLESDTWLADIIVNRSVPWAWLGKRILKSEYLV